VSVRARWYPCTLRLPGEPRPRSKAYVMLVEGTGRSGLHVWRHPGEEPEVHLPVDWSRTVIPTGRQVRNGVDIYLADGGLVVATPGASCRCGALGRFAGPSWATSVSVRA
jgi:hypothetical protein